MKRNISLVMAVLMSTFVLAQTEDEATSAKSPTDIVSEFLTAYMRGDHATFANLLHQDVIWIQPGENKLSGVKKSKSELLQMGAAMSKMTGGSIKLVNVKYFSSNGSTVSCILHWKATRPDGEVLDVDNIDVYTVENGKIIIARIFSEDIAKENKFWGK